MYFTLKAKPLEFARLLFMKSPGFFYYLPSSSLFFFDQRVNEVLVLPASIDLAPCAGGKAIKKTAQRKKNDTEIHEKERKNQEDLVKSKRNQKK